MAPFPATFRRFGYFKHGLFPQLKLRGGGRAATATGCERRFHPRYLGAPVSGRGSQLGSRFRWGWSLECQRKLGGHGSAGGRLGDPSFLNQQGRRRGASHFPNGSGQALPSARQCIFRSRDLGRYWRGLHWDRRRGGGDHRRSRDRQIFPGVCRGCGHRQ